MLHVLSASFAPYTLELDEDQMKVNFYCVRTTFVFMMFNILCIPCIQ